MVQTPRIVVQGNLFLFYLFLFKETFSDKEDFNSINSGSKPSTKVNHTDRLEKALSPPIFLMLLCTETGS